MVPEQISLYTNTDLELADAMCPVSRLIFRRRVPPRIIVNNGVSSGEIESGSTSF